MRLRHLFSMSLANLRRNRLRSALSLLGIVIGVFSVTLIVSLGYGLKAYVTSEVEAFGNNTVAIHPAIPSLDSRNPQIGDRGGVLPASLTKADLDALVASDQFPYVDAIAGLRTAQEYAVADGKEFRVIVIGTSADYPAIDGQAKVGVGRFFTGAEERGGAAVAVLGHEAAAKLFGGQDPLGRKIRVKDVSMTVVGVMAKRGSLAFFDFDSILFVPLKLSLSRITGLDHLNEIDVRVTDVAFADRAKEDLERWMRRQHGITDPAKDDFLVTTSKEVLERLDAITGAITALLGFLAAISLLVGGIGIMNIMLVSVTERIREVGLRKALGARNDDIRLQFLIESAALTTVGGLIGGAVGFLLTFAAIAVARHFGFAVPYLVSLPAFGAAALVSAVIGIVFGLYPANKAASLDPISSLRFE